MVITYKDLITEIQHMWNVKAKVIPVIIGATGTIPKSLRQYLSNVPGKYEMKELQKNSHIVHCTLTAGSDNIKVKVNIGKSVPLQARVLKGCQEIKVPRLRDNGPGWW